MSAAEPTTLAALCRANALEHGSRTAFVDGGEQASFAGLDATATRLAAAIARRGVGRGDRVAVLLRDGLPLVEIQLACAKLGAIFLPLNWRLAAPEIAFILGDARPSLWLVSERFRALAEGASAALPAIVVPDREPHASGAFRDLLASADDRAPADETRPEEAALLLYTSGTTGRPKGCLLSHRGLLAAAFAQARHRGLGRDDRLLSPLPLFHVGGLGVLLAHFAVGATVVFAPQPIDAPAFLRMLADEACTTVAMPPTLRAEIVRLRAGDRAPLALRQIVTAGTTLVDRASFEALLSAFDARFVLGYGQTEASGFIALMDGEEQRGQWQAVGRVLPHLEARICDGADRALPDGEAGELQVRGPSVMIGYWENPAATAAALRDGWLHTGDVFRRDERGVLHFAGRTKELIKSGGENVYPAEVEQALLAHEAIRDCCVVGVPDARWGEAVKAFVVLAPGVSVAREDVVAWCRKSLAGYKRPRYVEFVSAIPRSVLGKADKLDLAARPVTAEQAVA